MSPDSVELDILPDFGEVDVVKLVFNLFFAGPLAFMLLTSLEFDWRDQFFPLIVGIPTLCLMIANLFFILKPDYRERYFRSSDEGTTSLQEKLAESIEGTATEGRPLSERRRYERLLIVWIAVLPPAMYLFGMSLVLPVYVFAFVWYFGGSDLKRSLGSAVVFSVMAYLVFVVFLDYPIPAGTLFR